MRYGEEFLGLGEDAAEEDWKENEEDVARLDKRYRISYSQFEDILKSDQFFEKFGAAPRRAPMNNVLSGTNVSLKYGEGLLDFIYADFDSPAQLALNHLRWWDAVHRGESAAGLSAEKVYDQTQEIVEQYYRYQNTLPFLKEVMIQSLYTITATG